MPSLSPKQENIIRQYFAEKPKILILEGAVRSGKTYINNLLFYFLLQSTANEGKRYIITGHTSSSIRRNVLDPFNDTFGTNIKITNVDNSFSLWGNTIFCFGTDKADSYKHLTGMTADGWYANEITLQHENSVLEAFARTSGENARILWDTNPDWPAHPIKMNYIDQNGDKLESGGLRIRSHHFTIDDNPFLPAEYVENLKKSTPPGMWYERKINGQWVMGEGVVYDLFDTNMHLENDEPLPEWLKYRSIDFGFNNPFVCLWGAKDDDDCLHIYDEHYKAEKGLKYHAAEINRRKGEWARTVADHDRQDRYELADLGIHTNPAKKDVSTGIQKVVDRLIIKENGKPRLVIHRRCVNLIREMGTYAWAPMTGNQVRKEEPLKINDHCVDALRYMVMEIDHGGFILI